MVLFQSLMYNLFPICKTNGGHTRMLQKLISLLKKTTVTLLLIITLSTSLQDFSQNIEYYTVVCHQEAPDLGDAGYNN